MSTLKDDPEHKFLPVILLTAKAAPSDEFWGVESGADLYVTKPFDEKDLIEEIRRLLDDSSK